MTRGESIGWALIVVGPSLGACAPPASPSPVPVASPPATTPSPPPQVPVGAPRLDALDDAEPAASSSGPTVEAGDEPAEACDWVVVPGKHIVPAQGEGPPRTSVTEGTVCLWGYAIPLAPLDRDQGEPPIFAEKGCSSDGEAVRCPGVSWLFTGPSSTFEKIHVTPLDE